jgi:polysaccharide pyruvyl transferase WcaK-like protein
MKKKCLLLGSFGQTNIGDDILLYNCLAFLEKFKYERIYVNANVAENIPAEIKARFKNIVYIETYRASMIKWLICFCRSNHIFYGGGTIFKELYKTTGRSRYSVIIRILAFNLAGFICRKKIINLYIGIGSIKTSAGRLITKYCLLFSTLTIFRDKNSYAFARYTLKIPTKKISVSTDGLFLNRVWREEWKGFDHEKITKGRFAKIIGVNLLSDIPDWIGRKSYLRAVGGFIDFLTGCNYLVILIPFQHKFNDNNDHRFMDFSILPNLKNCGNVVLLDKVGLSSLNSLFGQMDCFVGMRFHSLLLSLVNQTPFIGIEYDTKCSRFIKENDYHYSVRLENISTYELIGKFISLNENPGQVKKNLRQIAEKHYKGIARSYDQIFAILDYGKNANG